MIKYLAGIALIIFSVSYAQAENIWTKKHEIDRWTENALKKAGGVTYDTIEVYKAAYDKWDAALNSAYKELMKRLPEDDKNLLRESQRNWIKYRDTEFSFISKHIQREGGTLSRVIVFQRMNEFIRSRVIDLEAYIVIFDTLP